MELEVVFISPPEYEKLAAEICYHTTINEVLSVVTIMELNTESDALNVEIFPPIGGDKWVIPYDDLLEALLSAKKRLIGE